MRHLSALGAITGLALSCAMIPAAPAGGTRTEHETWTAATRAHADSLREQLRIAESELRRLQGAIRRLRADQRDTPNASDRPFILESLVDMPKVIGLHLGHAADREFDRTAEESAIEARETPGQWIPPISDAYAGRSYSARRFDSVTLDPTATVVVSHQYGDVVVEPSDGCEAEVLQRLSFTWNGEDLPSVRAYLAALGVAMRSQDDSMLLQMTRPTSRPASIGRLNVDLTVRVPHGRAVAVASQYGDVVIRELETAVSASSAFGDVDVIRTTGPLSIRAQNGDVLVRRHEGAVSVQHTAGSVGIQETSGPIEFAGRFSDAWFNNIDGGCTVSMRGGSLIATGIDGHFAFDGVRTDVDIRGASSAVTLTSDQADVRLAGLDGRSVLRVQNGRLQVNGGEGDLTVTGAHLAVRVEAPAASLHIVNSDGDVVIDARGVESVPDVNARATRGAIAVYLPNEPSADVHVVSRRGEILTDMALPVTRVSGQVLAQGRLGDGQASLVLESEGGRVYVYSADGVARLTGGSARPAARARERRVIPESPASELHFTGEAPKR